MTHPPIYSHNLLLGRSPQEQALHLHIFSKPGKTMFQHVFKALTCPQTSKHPPMGRGLNPPPPRAGYRSMAQGGTALSEKYNGNSSGSLDHTMWNTLVQLPGYEFRNTELSCVVIFK